MFVGSEKHLEKSQTEGVAKDDIKHKNKIFSFRVFFFFITFSLANLFIALRHAAYFLFKINKNQ